MGGRAQLLLSQGRGERGLLERGPFPRQAGAFHAEDLRGREAHALRPRLRGNPYGDPARPEAVIRGSCPSRATGNEILAGALEVPVELGPGETRELRFVIGNSSDDLAETPRMVVKRLAPRCKELIWH